MKRVLSLVLAISMVFSMFTFSFAGTALKDVEGTEYEAAVEALVELGVVDGYTDGTYLPNKEVSRAEMAKLLVVAAGLEDAAEIAEGATKFSDVNGGWESGYVNVASEYGYIAGYPDGSFRPNETVTYAEAATMALRVLGYKSVIEAKGTWPINYMSKAQDLELLEDVTFDKYTDGAKRGNVAVLIWNMLKTQMWDVTGESEGDGLQYSYARMMLNVKFPDYSYSKAEFVDFEINADGEVLVSLDDSYDRYTGELASVEYEYLANDFYTFVPGTEVEVLVNEEDAILLTMVRTDRDTLVEGSKVAIDDKYDALDSEDYDYAYAMIERKDVAEATLLEIESEYVEEVKSASTSVRINKTTYKDKDYDTAIVLMDGERTTLREVEEGTVLSKVTVNGEEFFVIGSSEVDGKLTKYTTEDYAALTIGGEEYLLDADAKYVEDPEDEDETPSDFAKAKSLWSDMKNEEVVAILDFVNRVVRVEFDGSIEDEDSEIGFFVAMSDVERDSDNRQYYVELEDADGQSDTRYFSTSINTVAKALYNADSSLKGRLVLAVFDDEEEIIDFVELVDAEGAFADVDDIEAVEGFKDDYTVVAMTAASYDEKKLAVADDSKEARVNENTILVSVTCVDENKESTKLDDEYETTFEADANEDVDGHDVLVITEKDKTNAKYVIRLDDASSSDAKLANKVTDKIQNWLEKEGEYEVELDGETLIYKHEDNDSVLQAADDILDYVYGVLVYTTKEAKEDGEEITKVKLISALDLETIKALDEKAMIITEKADNEVYVGDELVFEFGSQLPEAYKTKYEDTIFVLLDVDTTVEDDEDIISSVELKLLEEDEENEIEALVYGDVNEDDVIVKDETANVMYIISGLDFDGEEADGGNDDDEGSNEPSTAVEYTITWSVMGVETTTKVAEGLKPSVEDPVVEGYTFAGWTPEIEFATEDARYVATFEVAAETQEPAGN